MDEAGYDVRLVEVAATPTAVVAAATTWAEFPSLWGTLLDSRFLVRIPLYDDVIRTKNGCRRQAEVAGAAGAAEGSQSDRSAS